jgi:hypothetical protein
MEKNSQLKKKHTRPYFICNFKILTQYPQLRFRHILGKELQLIRREGALCTVVKLRRMLTVKAEDEEPFLKDRHITGINT